ncbi:MAG TPA: hypothetical protein VMU41_15805 [Candidatus Binataceae bacterium]|nr:hypothetical protein [Candidatus Binataceae bacterium]
MIKKSFRSHVKTILLGTACGALVIGASTGSALSGSIPHFVFFPGSLVVSRSVYDNNPNNVTVEEQLPPGCSSSNCVSAGYNGTYPTVFNNASIDGSFGITSRIFLDQILPNGLLLNSLEVPNSLEPWVTPSTDQLVTSFSSKSELALNLSLDQKYLTFMGYVAPVNAIDVSNANTPGVIDTSNPDPGPYYRAAGKIDFRGDYSFTETNAYSGDNGRAAVYNNVGGDDFFYTAGNAGNGSNPQPNGIILGAGAQFITPADLPESSQDPGSPTPVGSFNITQLGHKADKIGKDTNFRGLTIFNNVVYYSKGSGGNGVNTVYFIDTTGNACPSSSATPGVGLPQTGAALPTSSIDYDPTALQPEGVVPYNMCILAGFPTTLAKNTTWFPFGIWFANANTVYVADEGNGDNTYSTTTGTYINTAAQTTAGLQKWTFNGTTWNLDYTLTAGLNLGTPYTDKYYPTGDNAATGLPWAPATAGLRNITGSLDYNGTATIYAITSTVSGGGDEGADPNMLVKITDDLNATSLPAAESFTTVRSPRNLTVLRGVAFTPTFDFSNY